MRDALAGRTQLKGNLHPQSYLLLSQNPLQHLCVEVERSVSASHPGYSPRLLGSHGNRRKRRWVGGVSINNLVLGGPHIRQSTASAS